MSDDQASGSCLFCHIVAGRVPAKMVFSDEQTVAFRDINPQAPTHILVIPRAHIADAAAASGAGVWESLMSAATRIALDEGRGQAGYRLIVNSGSDAGQSVQHLHVHILGGRAMTWPPG